MKKDSVITYLDRKIASDMVKGKTLLSIKDDLCVRVRNMITDISIEKDKLPHLKSVSINTIIDNIDEYEVPIRIKYLSFYVSHAQKRAKDMDWIIINKNKFSKFSNSEIFNLIKLKEKLSYKK
jgi:hypothetical protein